MEAKKWGDWNSLTAARFFLDEVGDIPLDIQPKLLRSLQEQEFDRLGSTRTLKINVRLIAAINRDLDKMTGRHRLETACTHLEARPASSRWAKYDRLLRC
jgi:formate hydrogenlyase transcriptional activator